MTLLTVGYGNRGVEPFFRLLGELGVTHLIDVRTTPYSSYHLDFGREILSATAKSKGFKYAYMGDTLGGEASSTGGQPYELGLNFLYRKLQKEPESKLCLMCGCLRAESCHRGKIVGESLLGMGLEVLHVDENGVLVPQGDLRLRMAPQQLQLSLD